MEFDKKLGIGIDLGTANLLVHVEKQGIVFNEPSVVAFDRETGKVIAAGKDAYAMLGKAHNKIAVIKPMYDGVITDMRACKALLAYVFNQLDYLSAKDLGKVKTLICLPNEVNTIDKQNIIDLAVSMGMGETTIEEEIKASAVGAGLDIKNTKGAMVINIGGGTSNASILSYGEIILLRTMHMAGNYINEIITKHVKREHHMEIGDQTAERIKLTLATLDPNKLEVTERYAGRDTITGLPKWTSITNSELRTLITPIYEEIAKLVEAVLRDVTPEIASDVLRHGIVLTGGGALMDGAVLFISERVKAPIQLASDPLTCVAEGSQLLLKERS